MHEGTYTVLVSEVEVYYDGGYIDTAVIHDFSEDNALWMYREYLHDVRGVEFEFTRHWDDKDYEFKVIDTWEVECDY